MNQPDTCTVALAFVARINAGDVEGLAALMTEDHQFIDIPGEVYRGREQLREGWQSYYRLFPDYCIHVARTLEAGDTVVMLGDSAGTLSSEGQEALRRVDGTLPDPSELQGPAIWTARIEDGLVAQWCVYADTAVNRSALGLTCR